MLKLWFLIAISVMVSCQRQPSPEPEAFESFSAEVDGVEFIGFAIGVRDSVINSFRTIEVSAQNLRGDILTIRQVMDTASRTISVQSLAYNQNGRLALLEDSSGSSDILFAVLSPDRKEYAGSFSGLLYSKDGERVMVERGRFAVKVR